MATLRSQLIRLAHSDPALRPHLLPLLKEANSGLAGQFEAKMNGLMHGGPLEPKAGKDLAAWMEANFHFQGSKTPRGGKVLKDALRKLHWWLNVGLGQSMYATNPDALRTTLEESWDKLRPHLTDIVKLFSEEGGKVVPKEIKVGENTYLNLSGFSEDQLTMYVTSLEQVFDELKGWRRKALAGGLKIAIAGPREFHGTASGKYKSQEDTLFVRATPNILKRTRGSYGAFDYIIVHEVGHRYELRRRPDIDFDRQEWATSKYSRNEGEAFAELFAISNFGIQGPWDQSIIIRFEEAMSSGKVPEAEPQELPPHLKKLLGK